ncbi:MAG: amino acid ABC transporter ATP-binding protein [Terrisporobacter othiniensis]|uniref:Amino acid ABC transporter ATP-binding protein n=3 Tax=Terrisporobacter TaxID=1505652 RepID=A0AAX2ZNR8_9FIRM|nr:MULTISPECIES: amino acid ABC transporter ATP-binding protein [Terrisporobacter]MBN9648019.1 amino acid ABC transporter ATP-binding protein [Terrisporobacter glycolicus]MDU4862525.1 amino acid ABC transporter ATP-binding protein [Terrisporobacter othiniensis]MCC3864980.1 amino acid ABC transporter ATP-binding protein [Terrisporobacter petrolearius]MDU6996152.1 amino acid ABC transporter ATP-binding protein [Terrisporobacter othiniensis]UEL49237.1 amino acid ABC transporter ATP-binding protei
MLKINSLSKKFDQNIVLKNIDLEVKKGEVVVLIGPSGTGKSTLLRCINILEKADSGSLTIGDLNVDLANLHKKDILKIRRKTAMVFQNYNLFNNKTVIENITEPLIVVKKIDKESANKIALEKLKLVGIEEKKDEYPSRLSGGQKQRVAIARALAVDPEVILMDEPTSALDPELVGEVLDVIRSLAKAHMTMIIVSHEMKFAREIADRIIFMENGVIEEEGSPSELFRENKNTRINQFAKIIV